MGMTMNSPFLLDVTVLDYPPQFRSKKTDTILEKVILYVNEDQLLDKWINPRDFYAYNPDPEPDDYKEQGGMSKKTLSREANYR